MISAIIQARTGSHRFPNKVFADINGVPMLSRVVDIVRKCELLDNIVVATTNMPGDKAIVQWGKANGIDTYCGNEADVVSRFCDAAEQVSADVIVRITADCPLKDIGVMSNGIKTLLDRGFDFVSTELPPTYPEGIGTEVFTTEALRVADREAREPSDREHVTLYFYKNPKLFRQAHISSSTNLSGIRLTVDEEKDLQLIRHIYARIDSKGLTSTLDYVSKLIKEDPRVVSTNADVKRSLFYRKIPVRVPDAWLAGEEQ